MKRFMVVLALILAANSAAFSQNVTESWSTVGANFANNFQKDEYLGDFYAGSSGVNFSRYRFRNHNKIGSFYNMGILFPVTNNIENDFSPSMQVDFLFGVGFRNNISEKLILHYGVGFNFNFSSFTESAAIDRKNTDYRQGFGIGGDIGLKYDITDIVYLNFGTALMYNFASYRVTRSTEDNWTTTRRDFSGWVNSPSNFGIRPYLGFGFNLYYHRQTERNIQWGTPK
jgi:hypothetical protein